jgi:non-specific serine/threonine protein kinase
MLGIEGIVDPVRVGQGSYGVVYRASQPAFGRTVAVKVLSTSLDDDSRRQFDRECRALGSLSGHPHIVTLHSAGITTYGYPYLIMDYLPGGSLAARLSGGPLRWEEVIPVGIKVAGALATAHDNGILHRDIKPENILVSAYGEPQLGDFGVAKIQGGTTTTMSTITGSVAHAAPEVLSGMAATVSSDIWSLASTLATLLAGLSPFQRPGDEGIQALITRILTQPPQDLRLLGVPESVCLVIEHGLAKDSWERPQTAVAFGEALQDCERSSGLAPTAMIHASQAAPLPLRADERTAPPAVERPAAPVVAPPPEGATVRRRPGETPVTVPEGPTPLPAESPSRSGPGGEVQPVLAKRSLVDVVRDRWRWLVPVVAVGVVIAIILLVTGGGKGKSHVSTPPTSTAASTTTAAAPPGRTVSVPGTQAYTDTGIDLAVGDSVTITATGTIEHNIADPQGTMVGPDGDLRPQFRQFNVPGLPSANHAALIGKVGDSGAPFVVGHAYGFTASDAGRLFLGINDVGVANNGGSFTAIITVNKH